MKRELKNPVLSRGLGRRLLKEITDMPIEKRRFNFHLKLITKDGDKRVIEGYASTRDIDRTGEVVEPNAFADSLKEYMTNPILTFMHDWRDPVGKVVDARIDDNGLFIRAEISETAAKVWKLIEEGILRAFSIGYEVIEEKVIGGINNIIKLALFEVAVVSIPANQRCLFSVAKALERGHDLINVTKELEAELRAQIRAELNAEMKKEAEDAVAYGERPWAAVLAVAEETEKINQLDEAEAILIGEVIALVNAGEL